MSNTLETINRSEQKLFKVIVLLTILYMFALPFQIKLILYSIRIPALLLITLYLVHYFSRYKIKSTEFICLIGFVFVVIFSAIYSNTRFTFDIGLSMISIILYLALIISSKSNVIDDECIFFLNKVSIVSTIMFIIYSFAPFSHMSEGRSIIYLTLGYANPNMTAIYLFFIYAILFITRKCFKKKSHFLFLLLSLFYLIILTNCRTVLIASIILPFTRLFFKTKVNKTFILFCTLIPFLFVFIYLYMFRNMGDIEIMGKSLFSGRQENFVRVFDSIENITHVLIGNFNSTHFDNSHNGPLSIFGSVGLIGVILFFYVFISKLLDRSIKYSEITISSTITLLCCFIHSSGEAALFLGGFPGLTFMFVFYTLLRVK